ncbi:MAG: polyamine aminopropyltransferase [Polyangiaceae bacterium]|jgi:spermidine synthase|nr:polyamine aminopropyltransferase [Polyangiaceae bacterium]
MTEAKGLASPALLASVFIIATSGLVYQLVCATLASYVLGDSVAQFSFVIGLYLFAMGIGSYLSKLLDRDLLVRFVEIELGLALAGGLCAPILFRVYAVYGAFRLALYALVTIIGTLVGLEIPILLRLLKFNLELKDLVARVLTLDYIGALVASVLFPAVFLPRLGIHQTSLFFGGLNAVVALIGTFLFPLPSATKLRLRVMAGLVLGCLAFVGVWLGSLIKSSETIYFGAPIVYVAQSPYQRIVVTQTPKTTRLFLNGNLQFSSDDEYRYHEALVHPAVAAYGRGPVRALVLGGGDGLAVRELLRYPSIERIDLIDLDSAMTDLFRDHPLGTGINGGSLKDPRVHITNEDAFRFLDEADTLSYDVAIVDFPDPGNYSVGKLYTDAFYTLLRQRLGVRGVAAIQATSPGFARRSFWSIVATIESAGFSAEPYHAYVPSFGEWGFVLAGGPSLQRPERLVVPEGSLRFLDDRALVDAFRFPKDISRVEGPINRLNEQKLVPLYTTEWGELGR